MSRPDQNAQNPYLSFLVPASAGSGKTYQLSRRFLGLVAAHALPSQILTVTFTKKAAGEMRARILATAATLIADPDAQKAFDQDMQVFHTASGQGTAPPLAAQVVGRTVLASSQLLKISTIDSLFLEWVSKFPFESEPARTRGPAGAEDMEEASADDGHVPFPSPFRLADNVDARAFTDLAWRSICQILTSGVARGSSVPNEAVAALLAAFPDCDLERLSRRLKALEREDTFLWYAEQKNGAGQGFLPIPLGPDLQQVARLPEPAFVQSIASPVAQVAAKLANGDKRDAVLAALQRGRIDLLLAAGFISKSTGQVSGNIIRGKNRDAVAAEIHAIDACLARYFAAQKICALNQEGAAYYQLFNAYGQARDVLKYQANKLEFKDLAKGAFRLFHGDAGAGVRFLLSRTIHHVLLDEFQDTSRLQWSIFSEMALTLLSGAGASDGQGARPSVFIVGDAKQSIYGFREADPAVMMEARETLRDYIQVRPLSASYRTAPVILDYVNAVFGASGRMPEFPLHTTATLNGRGAVPNMGRVMLFPLVEAREDVAAAEAEAEMVADALEKALTGVVPCPVPVKGDPAVTRQLMPGDCAILYRSTTHAGLFERALRRRGIPCQREEERGFFTRPEVADTVALLRFLCAPSDILALATVLRSPFVRLPDPDLLEVLRRSSEDKAADDGERHLAILDLLSAIDPPTNRILHDLIAKTDLLLPHALLTEALTQMDALGRWSRLLAQHPGEASLARANLLRLIELCLTLESGGHTTLGDVLQRLAILAEDDEVGNASAARFAVTLMTIHKSKGLEYPLVAVVDTGRAFGQQDPYWAQQKEGSSSASGLSGMTYIGVKAEQPHGSPSFDQLSQEATQKITDESLRLLYVALTRAKHYLLLSGHKPASERGLSETAPYDLLQTAMTTTPPSATGPTVVPWTDVPHPVWEWSAGSLGQEPSSGYGELEVPSSSAVHDRGSLPPAAPPPVAMRRPWNPSSQPREWRVRSPSRHDGAASGPLAAGVTLEVKPWAVPDLATVCGTLIHQGLDAFLRGRPFDGAKVWQSLAPLRYRDPRYAAEALRELDHALADPLWPTLLKTAHAVETELPIVFRPEQSTHLMIGTLDLLIESRDKDLLVIDHKTTRFVQPSEGISEEALKAFARDRRWDEQLRDYGRAVAALYDGRPVTQAVYFSSLRRLVPVD